MESRCSHSHYLVVVVKYSKDGEAIRGESCGLFHCAVDATQHKGTILIKKVMIALLLEKQKLSNAIASKSHISWMRQS